MAVHIINFTIIPADTRLDNHGVNKGVSPILFDGEKEDFQIDLLVFDAELARMLFL